MMSNLRPGTETVSLRHHGYRVAHAITFSEFRKRRNEHRIPSGEGPRVGPEY
jgi:hypothetical protein